MNIIQMQDRLKDLSDNQLRDYVEKPRNMQGSGIGQGGTSHGYVPTFLVLGEMKRRKDSRSKYEGEKTQQKTTVADDLVAAQGIGGNQMTQNPMSQPTAGVGTPQPVNPAMLASKGVGQLDPGAVKQMNDGGIVGYAGTDGVSLVGEDKEVGDLVKERQETIKQTDYSLNDFPGIGNLDLLRNKTYEEPGENESYSAFGRFLKGGPSIEDQKKKDINLGTKKILDNINRREEQLKYSIFTDLSDKDREYRDAEQAKLKILKGKVLDSHSKGKLYSDLDTEETIISDVVMPNGDSEVVEQINNVAKVEPKPDEPKDFQGQSSETRLTEDFINRDSNQNNDFLESENVYKSVYGKDEPIEQMNQEDFMKELTGEGSAFAKQQKTTKEFKEDLLKRADDKIMSTDEILMNVGFNMMADKGGETNALRSLIGSGGRAAIDTVKKVKAGEKEGDALRDKVNQLEMNMNATETELATKALQFGVNSKQFAEKSRQFGLSLQQAEDIANVKITSNEKVARIGAAAKVKSARITAEAAKVEKVKGALISYTQKPQNNTTVNGANSFIATDIDKLKSMGSSATTLKKQARDYMKAVESYFAGVLSPEADPRYVEIKNKFKELEGGGSEGVVEVTSKEQVNNLSPGTRYKTPSGIINTKR